MTTVARYAPVGTVVFAALFLAYMWWRGSSCGCPAKDCDARFSNRKARSRHIKERHVG